MENQMSMFSVHRSRTLVPSTAGFSRPDGVGFRSLQELLLAIQPLQLPLYIGASLRDHAQLGVGGSYHVLKCLDTKNSRLVAVKQIKRKYDPNCHTEFHRLVHCVLRDMEVMHHPPLAHHLNILGILGYGWGLTMESILPFIVVEFAELGTMREYLATSIEPRQVLDLCTQVTSGLDAMHRAGVAHGDLKLENDLILMNECPIAKVSDFGHSCLLSGDQDVGSQERYLGTKGYLAPEIFTQKSSGSPVDAQRCDIWALGLLVWESFMDGSLYYKRPAIKKLLSHSGDGHARDGSIGAVSKLAASKFIETTEETFSLIAQAVLPDALDFIRQIRNFRSYSWAWALLATLQDTLQTNPQTRCVDVSKLHINVFRRVIPTMPQSHLGQSVGEVGWDFTTFMPENVENLPFRAKSQVVADATQSATSGNDPKLASLAAAYLAMAYGTGYGVDFDFRAHVSWLQTSKERGLREAVPLLEFLTRRGLIPGRSSEPNQLGPISHLAAFASTFTGGILNATASLNLDQDGNEKTSGPGGLRSKQYRQDSELLEACRLGKIDLIRDLIARGHDPFFPAEDGCLPLHFAFMFEDQQTNIVEVLGLLLPEGHLGSTTVNRPTTADRSINAIFPIRMRGSPLNFAVAAGARTVVEMLLDHGAHPLHHQDPTRENVQKPQKLAVESLCPLETAVSYHQKDIFEVLWAFCLRQQGPEYLRQALIEHFDHGVSLISALSLRSILERYLVHGLSLNAARQSMISCLFHALSTLGGYADIPATRSSGDFGAGENNIHLLALVIASGLERILRLGDPEMAREIFAELQRHNTQELNLSELVIKAGRDTITKAALDAACSKTQSIARSVSSIEFARQIGGNDNFDSHALLASMHNHNEPIFRYVLEQWIGFGENATHGELLHQMISSGFSALQPLSTLLSKGIYVNFQDDKGCTPLHLATEAGLSTEAESLLEYGADTSLIDQSGATVLHIAVKQGQTKLASLILNSAETGIQNAFDKDGYCALSIAVVEGFSDVFDLLLKMGVNVNVPANMKSPLHCAAEFHNVIFLKRLLNEGACVDCRDSAHNTPLHATVLSTKEDTTNFACGVELLQNGADPYSLNRDGKAMIHCALENLSAEKVYKIFELYTLIRKDLDIPDADGATILHYAMKKRNLNLLREACRYGASLEALDNQSRTILHTFVLSSYSNPSLDDQKTTGKLLEMLLCTDSHGLLVNPCHRDASNQTALDYAISQRCEFIFTLLVKAHLRLYKGMTSKLVSWHGIRQCDEYFEDYHEGTDEEHGDILWSAYTSRHANAASLWDNLIFERNLNRFESTALTKILKESPDDLSQGIRMINRHLSLLSERISEKDRTPSQRLGEAYEGSGLPSRRLGEASRSPGLPSQRLDEVFRGQSLPSQTPEEHSDG